MSAGPDIHGMVNDQQFQSLPPRDQRRALYQLTNDQSFQGLSDADTMRFVGSMRATSTAATTTPVIPTGSITATPPSDPVGSTLKFLKGFGQTAGTAALSPNTMGQGGLGQPIPEGTPDFSLTDALKGHLSLPEMLAKLKGDVSTANPLKPLLDKPHDPEALGQASANVAMLARGLGQGMETPADLTKKIPTGDLAAKGKAVSKLLGQEALAKVPIAGRVVRRPSFTDYAEALAQKSDPQMALFKNVPKLGDFPATQTPEPVATPAPRPRKAVWQGVTESTTTPPPEAPQWQGPLQQFEPKTVAPAPHAKIQLGTPQPVQGVEGVADYPIIKDGERVGHARISISGDEARVGWFGPDDRAAGAPVNVTSNEVRALKTQFESANPGVKLKITPGSATKERVAARAARRGQSMEGYYGTTPTRSNVGKNLRQQQQMGVQVSTPAEPPAHPPNIMRILTTPGDISDADMKILQDYMGANK